MFLSWLCALLHEWRYYRQHFQMQKEPTQHGGSETTYALDRAVEVCYRPQPFDNDQQRVEHLFALYEKLTAPLLVAPKKSRRKAKSD
jgi:hypothetical protein